MATAKKSITVQGVEVNLTTRNDEDYISLTDMVAKFDGGGGLIESWLRNKDTVEFLGLWERLNNKDFNAPGFEAIRAQAGLNRFTLSVRTWVEQTNGIGLIAKTGGQAGTFAHKDIAFEFGFWLSPEFKLYLLKEFQRVKQQEALAPGQEWTLLRSLSKIQQRVHTDAIKAHLIPPDLDRAQAGFVYSTEADMLNMALFGITARDWRAKNPGLEGTLRDHATVEQLVVLSSLESQNALLIAQQVGMGKRLGILNGLARAQMVSLLENPSVKKISGRPLSK